MDALWRGPLSWGKGLSIHTSLRGPLSFSGVVAIHTLLRGP